MDGEMSKNLFIALVRLHLEFGNIVWSPKLITNRKLVEGVQKGATKLITELRNILYEKRQRRIKLPQVSYH